MKSLIAVLALTLAVGAGYWKMQNPDGSLPDARLQASGVVSRALSQARSGIDSIRSGGKKAQAALENQIEEKLSSQATETDSRLEALQQANTDAASKMAQRLKTLEQQLDQITDNSSQQLSLLADTVNEKSVEIEKILDKKTSEMSSSTTENLGNFQKQLDDLVKNQADSIASGISAFKATVQGELDNLKAGDQNSSIALDSFTEKLASLDTRLDTLSSATVSASASALNGSGSGSDGDADPNTGNADTANADTGITDTGNMAARLAAVTAQVDQRLAAMEDRLAAATNADTRSTLDALNVDVSNSRDSLARLEKVIQQNNAKSIQLIGSVQTELASLKEDLETMQLSLESSAIENSQNDLREQLTNLEKLVKSTPAASSDLTSISSSMEQSRDRIQTLEQRLTDLPASTDTRSAERLQEQLQTQIAALESRLAKAGSMPDKEIASTLSAVQQKMSELESKNYLTTDDIERLSETKSIQYKIYFSIGAVDISEDAAKVLDSLIAQEANRATNISIFGTTDRSGSFEFNQQLALRRANRVRSYLIQKGFEFTKIRDVDGIGEDLAAAILPDGQNDPNQRAVIIFAFQP